MLLRCASTVLLCVVYPSSLFAESSTKGIVRLVSFGVVQTTLFVQYSTVDAVLRDENSSSVCCCFAVRVKGRSMLRGVDQVKVFKARRECKVKYDKSASAIAVLYCSTLKHLLETQPSLDAS